MPDAATILEGLESIANQMVRVAAAWHLVLTAACVALILGWRPTQRRAAALLALPVLSVSAAAFDHGNPFNGILFALLALALLVLATRLEARRVGRGGPAATVAGIAMIAFGWLYPHFLAAPTPALYLVAAPTGLIPCPTLSIVVGFTLLAGGFGSRAWSLVTGVAGLFYGVFGFVRLGVRLDITLVAGAIGLLALALALAGRRTVPVSNAA